MEQRGDEAARVRGFAVYARKVLAEGQPVGAAVAAALDGRVVGEWGLGLRDVEAALPATPDTVFGIASVAKPFTALAVLLLQERGALAVADSVCRWLPEFRLPGPADAHAPTVTIHHLLTHSSGLPPEVALPYARARDLLADPDLDRLDLPQRLRSSLAEIEARGDVVDTYEALVARLAREQFALLAPPGRLFSYSGEGYALLAAIVERAAGAPFRGFVHEHVLDPLGMAGTGFRPGSFDRIAATHPVAQLYATARSPQPGRMEQGVKAEQMLIPSPAWWASGGIFGHANMVSTARDLLRFAELLRRRGEVGGRRIAARETVEAMLTPHVPIPTGGGYGYGLFVRSGYHGHTLVEHAGGGKGCGAFLAVLPEVGASAVALANNASGPGRLAMGALNALVGLPPGTAVQTFPQYSLRPQELAPFVGTYRQHGGDDGMTFELAGGALRVRQGDRTLPCRPCAADGVVVRGSDAPIRFLLDEARRAWALCDGARVLRKVNAPPPHSERAPTAQG